MHGEEGYVRSLQQPIYEQAIYERLRGACAVSDDRVSDAETAA